MRNKQPDKLSVEAALATAANMSYGQLKAMQPRVDYIPSRGIKCICQECGKEFIKYNNYKRFYCDDICRKNRENRLAAERRKASNGK